jgi:7-keto-8-aminopelargonate synthetase-like enzyme
MPTTDLKAVELRLRAILDPYREHLVEDEIYHMPVLRRKGAKKHDWFAGVQPVDGAVKFNFLPMHGNPALLEDASAALRKHKTGASVFRFTEIDENLAGELETVVAKGFLAYMGDR